MARIKNRFEQLEIRDGLALASIIGTLPRNIVEASLPHTGDRKQRNRTLPPAFTIYLLIFLCIFKDKATDEVLRMLFEGLNYIISDKSLLTASDAAISKARMRIGRQPLESIFHSFCKPLCDINKNPEGYYCGLLKCALDASELYLQCTDDVLKEFPVCEHEGKNPQSCAKLKFGAIQEVESHVYLDVEAGNGFNSEQDFADKLIGRLGAGKLLLGDRYYPSVANILRVKEQKSEILYRASAKLTLKATKILKDGTYLAEIKASKRKDSHAEQFKTTAQQYSKVLVRVINYAIVNAQGLECSQSRLITTLLDPDSYHAQDLIDLYTERWEVEMGFDEIKTHLMKGAQDNLRSKKSELVWQEFWAMLIAHYIIRKIMFEAAAAIGNTPRKMSFVGTKCILQRKTSTRPFSPSGRSKHRQNA